MDKQNNEGVEDVTGGLVNRCSESAKAAASRRTPRGKFEFAGA